MNQQSGWPRGPDPEMEAHDIGRDRLNRDLDCSPAVVLGG
jgi:hypothetical protein